MLNSAMQAPAYTNSWGAGSDTSCSTQSEDADDRTSTWDQYWNYDGMTVLFAAGNEEKRWCLSPWYSEECNHRWWAQKSIQWITGEMYYWSSRGPTDDGRLKPDLVGPGDGVLAHVFHRSHEGRLFRLVKWWYIEYGLVAMATPTLRVQPSTTVSHGCCK